MGKSLFNNKHLLNLLYVNYNIFKAYTQWKYKELTKDRKIIFLE